jgi:hypothetical protein
MNVALFGSGSDQPQPSFANETVTRHALRSMPKP